MQQSHREVVILKPTSVFLSFLSAQAPNADLPELEVMQTDSSAFTIYKQDGEEETLDEIERHYSTMFRHEIARWLGEDAAFSIEGSFLDFLCCFKFEMHSQMVLMEHNLEQGRNLLCVKPRSVLLKWVKSAAASEGAEDICAVMERVSLKKLTENSTVVVKNFAEQTEIASFVQQQYKTIFQAEMLRMCERAEMWPTIKSFEEFTRYFAVEVHTDLVHLF